MLSDLQSNCCSLKRSDSILDSNLVQALFRNSYTVDTASGCPTSLVCPRREVRYHCSLLTEYIRGWGLIRFANLTLQTIRMHPVMLMLRLIIGIWREIFFYMVSSYGKKPLRDKRSITCHERLLQLSVILPIKNASIVSSLNWSGSSFQKIVLLTRFLA